MVNRLTRYAQIAAILSKYGFGIFLQQLYPDDRRPDFLKPAEMDREDVYRRIRLAIEELGRLKPARGGYHHAALELFGPQVS